MSRALSMALALAAWVSFPSILSAQHAGDIWVGRTQTGELKLGGYNHDEYYVPLQPVSGLLNGWTDNDPGFDRVLSNDPANDMYTLQAGAQIWLRIVDLDPAFRVIDASFAILDAPGEQTFLGNSNLHTHLTWHINSNSPGFDPSQCVWNAQIQLLDIGSTAYDPTPPFTVRFTNEALLDATGDWDEDGDVDLQDFANFPDCFGDPDQFPTPTEVTTCEVDCLNIYDFDNDNDVDLRDFAGFLNTLGE